MTKETPDSPSPDRLRLEAAQKRAELGDTIDQLMAKTDVKAHAAKLVHEHTPEPVRRNAGPLLGAVAALVVTGVVLWRLRRSGKWG
ncbi:DUF3618 domain-containing protein [Streptomyces sp. LP05-1]|uniref:DUF3618 domain-containing protein n=1 Tax=Streptomyces pyxinae TaxID=2970734 RepID=A0ABT2CKT1_9ACTN|nr:DUF3618 domain-containing protein [Streptomyces sp. LP05-1]MCS0637306.1 DUF3618 domain-containing protein [Streptomyces sp. LP05-1]